MSMKRFVISLIIFQVLLLFVHAAVYATLVAAFGIPAGPARVALAIAFGALAFTFASASAITRRSMSRAASYYYLLAAYWFGLVHFLFVGALAFFIAAKILYSLNIYVAPELLGGIAFGAAFLIHSYGTWSSGRGRITSVTVSLKNLPDAWQGRRIAFISDVHLGDVRGARFAAKIARKVIALKPHALFIGGDLFDGPACDEKKMVEPFRAAVEQLPGGVHYVTGNHEYYMAAPERAVEAVRAMGARVLHDEAADMDGVQLVGIDDRTGSDDKTFAAALRALSLDPERPSIMLKHVPLRLEAAAAQGISLGLFGHTHQGQIFPLSLLTRRIYRGYDYGLGDYRGMKTYTSSGVGTWGPPLRLGTKSEIVVIEFRR